MRYVDVSGAGTHYPRRAWYHARRRRRRARRTAGRWAAGARHGFACLSPATYTNAYVPSCVPRPGHKHFVNTMKPYMYCKGAPLMPGAGEFVIPIEDKNARSHLRTTMHLETLGKKLRNGRLLRIYGKSFSFANFPCEGSLAQEILSAPHLRFFHPRKRIPVG